MSYSAGRRRSIGSPLVGLLASVLTFVILVWLIGVTARQATTLDGVFRLEAGLLVSFVLATVVHESGHLLVGLFTGEPVRMMRIGSGGTLVAFRVGGVTVQLCVNPLGGGAVYFSELGAAPTRVHIASLAAGPAFNALAAIYSFIAFQFGVDWLALFGIANVIGFVNNSIPRMTVAGGRTHATDGMQIWNLLHRPRAPMMSIEGAEIAPDAQTAILRAIEDAQLSGAGEAGDEELLRALAADQVVGSVFTASGLTARIPRARTPESDQVGGGGLGPAGDAILQASQRKARDLGLSKATAATLAIALLSSDTPSARLMSEAGITEESLRKLVVAGEDDEEAARRARVLSPDLPLERWGTAADAALAYAVRMAVADRSQLIGTQHLLAAIVAAPASRGAQALSRLGFVLAWTGDKEGSRDRRPEVVVPALSPQASLALAGALRRTGPSRPAGTAELCLGILDQEAGIGFQWLVSAGLTSDRFIKAVRQTAVEASEPAGCNETSYRLWSMRGGARLGAGRWVDAYADYLEASRVCANETAKAMLRNNAAWAALVSGDSSLSAEALELTRAALAVEPSSLTIRGTHALALMETGSVAEAATMLEEDLPKLTRPRSRASTLCQLAMCEARLGRREAAEQHLAAAAEASPKCELLDRARKELEVGSAAIA